MSTGQWLTSSDGARWFFEAGADSLDFAYAPDLGDWLASRFARLDANEVTERELADALSLREAIGRLAVATADGTDRDPDDIDTLNLFAATPDIPPALDGGHRHAGAVGIRTGQALATLARDAVAILAEAPDRIRRCDAADCRMVFRDESRTLNRRWCSMQRCGNRAKVRAHRARALLNPRDAAGPGMHAASALR